ncbi:hypothetical protein [Paenibacillus pini]|uniref:DUF4190 domain-containing protein n=1 Tax=Paenibacillus pini JCM 16418 TaxID=1236976 RepID=W7YNQ4_9BACL|nr:hypothetical protein [Paenibacillus pini]GAF06276.1 hypothetical protein JCM16418_227 [Paenibacillus pini JCM 16418]
MDPNLPPDETPQHVSQEAFQETDLQHPYSTFIPPIVLKHSGPGLASFVISLVTLLGYIISVAVMGSIIAPYINGDNTLSPDSKSVFGIGVVVIIILAFVVINIVGVVLGIVGTVMKQRKRFFAVIGLILNSFIVLGIGGFFVFALIYSTAL